MHGNVRGGGARTARDRLPENGGPLGEVFFQGSPTVMKVHTVLLAAFVAVVSADQSVINLNGDNWLLSDSSRIVEGLQATVPGQVHTAL